MRPGRRRCIEPERSVVLHPGPSVTPIDVQPSRDQRFATLVEPHLPALRAFANRRAPDLADDVMSEVGVVAWRRLDELPAGRERAWLFGVARTVLLAERRKVAQQAATRVAVEPNDLADPSLDPLLAPSVHRPLACALARLSDRDRELLLLTAWEGLSTDEAAAALGIRGTAARMGLVRARRRLAAALDDLDPGWSGARTAPARRQTDPSTSAEEVEPCAAAEH